MRRERSVHENDIGPRASRDPMERPIGPEIDGSRLFNAVLAGRTTFRECDRCNAREATTDAAPFHPKEALPASGVVPRASGRAAGACWRWSSEAPWKVERSSGSMKHLSGPERESLSRMHTTNIERGATHYPKLYNGEKATMRSSEFWSRWWARRLRRWTLHKPE